MDVFTTNTSPYFKTMIECFDTGIAERRKKIGCKSYKAIIDIKRYCQEREFIPVLTLEKITKKKSEADALNEVKVLEDNDILVVCVSKTIFEGMKHDDFACLAEVEGKAIRPIVSKPYFFDFE